MNIYSKLLVLAAPFLLVGCSLFQPRIQIVEVKIPVATVPKPPVTAKPTLEIGSADIATIGYDGYVKALEADLIRMKTYTNNLENVIHTYDVMSNKLEEVHTKEKINGNQK